MAVLTGMGTLTPESARATLPVIDGSNLSTNVANTATTVYGWLMEKGEWLTQQLGMVDQLTELITNNALTKAIRGFNELMTAIQTDISDVLGTIETLANTPRDIVDSIMEAVGGATGGVGSIMDIPKSVFGMLSSLPSEFQSVYDDVLSGFGLIAQAQAYGEDIGNALDSSGGAFGFASQAKGLNTALNTSWLQGSEARDAKVKEWDTAQQGDDQAQMQKVALQVQLEQLRQTYRDADMEAQKALALAAEDVAEAQVLAAKTRKTVVQTLSRFRLP
jgi:hypothetical protein